VAAAVVQLVLATAAHTYSVAGICPGTGDGLACAPLIRPRLAALGPLSVSQLAVVGATLAVGLAVLLALGKVPRGLARGGVAVLGGGVGFAMGLQVLPWRVSGAACLLCLGVVLAAGLAAALACYLAARGLKVRWREPALACLLSLVISTPRLAALEKAGGGSGPQLVLVTRPGCPYCDAFRADALGDPRVIEALGSTRGVREVEQGSSAASAHGPVRGVPTLFAVGSDGQRLGVVEGHRPADHVLAWLAEVTR
jgi:hypothetical protein